MILYSYLGLETLETCFVVVQSLSYMLSLCDPMTIACQAPLSFTISRALPKFMSIKLVTG